MEMFVLNKKICFGTDGWRGIIAEDFTFDNVRTVAGAIAEYLQGTGKSSHGMVIGYDGRFLSNRFADAVAEVFAGNGIPVYKASRQIPTPVAAFAVTLHKTAGAVMITASHNPPEYNGIKFIPEYAGPALPEVTLQIEEKIHEMQARAGREEQTERDVQPALPGGITPKADAVGAMAMAEYSTENDIDAPDALDVPDLTALMSVIGVIGAGRDARASIQEINPFADYAKHLISLVNTKAIGDAGIKVMINPFSGAGCGYLEAVLQMAGVEVDSIHNNCDPMFGGCVPEPTGKSLSELHSHVLEGGYRLGLALDGDGDRFGIIDANGEHITPNQFLPLLYDHLIETRGWVGPAIRTVATTHMMDRIAERHGQAVKETSVGFKYIAQGLMRGCIVGGEESGGLSIKGHIPEKDGLLANLLAVEMVAVHGLSLTELMAGLAKKYGKLYSDRLDIQTEPGEKAKVLDLVRLLDPPSLAGSEVVRRITVDGTKLVTESGAWVLIRPSGTEPLFRIYAEANSPEELRAIQKEVRDMLKL